jgi:hypothetical protein
MHESEPLFNQLTNSEKIMFMGIQVEVLCMSLEEIWLLFQNNGPKSPIVLFLDRY